MLHTQPLVTYISWTLKWKSAGLQSNTKWNRFYRNDLKHYHWLVGWLVKSEMHRNRTLYNVWDIRCWCLHSIQETILGHTQTHLVRDSKAWKSSTVMFFGSSFLKETKSSWIFWKLKLNQDFTLHINTIFQKF